MRIQQPPWGIILSAKALMVLAILIGLGCDFYVEQFRSAYAHWPETVTPTLGSRFSTWDCAHYLRLSQGGYEAGSSSCAFYPLWPALIRQTGLLAGGQPLLASLLVANGLSVLAFWLFYGLVKRHWGEAIGRDALILLLVFPGALFFSFPYTESPYAVLVLLCLWGLDLKQYRWSAVTSFLLPLARPVGLFIALPLAWHLYEQRRAVAEDPHAVSEGSLSANSRLSNWHWFLLLCPLLGYAAYFGIMYLWTGNAVEGFVAQKAYPNSPSIKNMFNLGGFFHALTNVQTLDGMMDSALDRAFFLLFLLLLPLLYRLDKTWFWYALPAGLVPAMTSWFVSYRRYTIVLFPVFIVLAQLLAKSKSRWVFWYYVILMAGLQVWAVSQFINFRWAG
jgi:hypothetical protein